MFNPAAVLTAAFGDHLAETYLRAFPEQKTQHSDFLNQIARETLENISRSDAPYHNSEHTMMVTLVGQQIILGKHKTSELHPKDWVHFIVALLLHDIGYTRDVCNGDTYKEVVINDAGDRVALPRGATDAWLAPHHVERGKIYVRGRFESSDLIETERIARAIEYTRFPVPADPAYACLDSEPALVRAADLIGQIADPHYLRKLGALYNEFVESGFAEQLELSCATDMVEQFPSFFHEQVAPLIGPALEHLNQTSDGQKVIAQLERCLSETSGFENRPGPFSGS